jgi:hypothetical protein
MLPLTHFSLIYRWNPRLDGKADGPVGDIGIRDLWDTELPPSFLLSRFRDIRRLQFAIDAGRPPKAIRECDQRILQHAGPPGKYHIDEYIRRPALNIPIHIPGRGQRAADCTMRRSLKARMRGTTLWEFRRMYAIGPNGNLSGEQE